MRIVALLAVLSGSGLLGMSAGGIVSTGEQLRAETHKCPQPHVRDVRQL